MADTSDEIRQRLRTIWFDSLRAIADLDLQQVRWLDRDNTNPAYSYVEFVCKYPDEAQLKDGIAKGYLSPAEATILLAFGETLTAHQSPGANDYDHEAILSDPVWHEVVRAAGTALQRLEELQS
jgi:hypothetical protein